MRHVKSTFKLGRNTSHRRSLVANMLKSLIEHGRIETTVAKAKELKRHADRMITLAKKETLASKRQIVGSLMIRHNPLNSKEKRSVKEGNLSAYNNDRKVLKKLVEEITPKYKERAGGYTRIIRTSNRLGDGAERCILEYV
ncbi:MAG: 50S ribosomal protein L17 [Chlamydiia bacterium]|nr:50S ribosomal protein L17 [Chlamydiia bacterium]MCH9616571.1 50S ribosomal protein L17 [Chlamydiia bacterium]MCH9629301.1 50S ribosomal protein L17 [Chlamydiia bacterium]